MTSDIETLMASSKLGPHKWRRLAKASSGPLCCQPLLLWVWFRNGVLQLLSGHHTVLSLVRWASLPALLQLRGPAQDLEACQFLISVALPVLQGLLGGVGEPGQKGDKVIGMFPSCLTPHPSPVPAMAWLLRLTLSSFAVFCAYHSGLFCSLGV